MKYGLVDKALEHLAEGVEKTGGDPSLIERIKDIHLDNGEMEQAVEHLLVLAQRLAPLEPERARIALKEVLLVDPDEGRAREMLESLAGAPAEVEEPGEEVEEPEEEVEELEEVEEVEELEEIPEAEEIAPVEPMALDAPIQEAEYSSFLDEETSDPGAHLPAVEQAAEQEVPEVRTDGADADLAALERETSEPGAPVPPPEQWDEEREERPSGPGGEEEMARALESVTLPDLELEEFDALDRETEEIEGPTVPDVFAEEPAEAPPEPPAAPPPPPEAPVSSTTSVAVEEALEEADFFISQGLKQEAALFLQDLLSSYPGNRLIEDKLAELSEGTPQDKPETDLFTGEPEPLLPPDPSEETELESASQITDEAFDALSAIESIIQEDGDGTEALGAQPTEIEASDARTHFDLGIAYMEMGVTESAIQEFRIASNAPEMEAVSYNMIGNCLMSAGRVEDAIKEYKLGLFAKDKTQDQELNLYYDIAEAYLKLEDQKEALYYLQNIKKKDPGFKDVKLKLVALSSSFKPSARASGAPAEEPKPAPAKDPGEAAREVDDAFDDLFGEFSGKDE
jgi:tetratricopeptide (TPR) repeat protein